MTATLLELKTKLPFKVSVYLSLFIFALYSVNVSWYHSCIGIYTPKILDLILFILMTFYAVVHYLRSIVFYCMLYVCLHFLFFLKGFTVYDEALKEN